MGKQHGHHQWPPQTFSRNTPQPTTDATASDTEKTKKYPAESEAYADQKREREAETQATVSLQTPGAFEI